METNQELAAAEFLFRMANGQLNESIVVENDFQEEEMSELEDHVDMESSQDHSPKHRSGLLGGRIDPLLAPPKDPFEDEDTVNVTNDVEATIPKTTITVMPEELPTQNGTAQVGSDKKSSNTRSKRTSQAKEDTQKADRPAKEKKSHKRRRSDSTSSSSSSSSSSSESSSESDDSIRSRSRSRSPKRNNRSRRVSREERKRESSKQERSRSRKDRRHSKKKRSKHSKRSHSKSKRTRRSKSRSSRRHSSSEDSSSEGPSQEPKQKYRQLPSQIPTFSGKVEDYLSWVTSINALILEDKAYTVRQKVAAMIMATKGVSGLESLSLFPYDKDGLKSGMDLIETIFGNRKRLVEKAIETLDKAKPIYHSDFNNVNALRSAFISARTSAEMSNQIRDYRMRIKEAVMTKLPDKIQNDIIDANYSDDKILDGIDKELAKELNRAREKEPLRRNKERNQSKDKTQNKSSSSTDRNTQAFRINDNRRGGPPECRFDGERHLYRECSTPILDRIRKMTSEGRCMKCLGDNHTTAQCYSKRICIFCQKPDHHSYLCDLSHPMYHLTKQRQNVPVNHQVTQVSRQVNPGASTENTNSSATDRPRFGQPNDVVTLKVNSPMSYKTTVVIEKNSGHPIRIMIDEASGRNFLTISAAERLGLNIYSGDTLRVFAFSSSTPVLVQTFADATLVSQTEDTQTPVQFAVVKTLGEGEFYTPPAWILQTISPHLLQTYCDDGTLAVEGIIGVRDAQLWMRDFEMIADDHRGRYSLQTSAMGLFVFGGGPRENRTDVRYTFTINELVAEVETPIEPYPDNFVKEFLQQHVRAIDGRIEVDVPVIDTVKLESNNRKCLKIMRNNVERWEKKGLLEVVVNILRDWEANGIIEPVKGASNNPHVLSYHVVEKLSSSTTKHRIVYNGSLKDIFGIHLNNKVFKGWTSWKILDSFTALRKQKFPLIGDLRQAFLMVSLSHHYRDLFQFYWPDKELEILYRFARVPFGTSTSPFLLYCAICKIIELQATKYPNLMNLINWFYVDDFICSFDDPQTRDEIRSNCEKIFKQYGFTIEWAEGSVIKVLGMEYDQTNGRLKVIVNEMKEPTTVKDLASLIPQRFDPFGITEPIDGELRRIFSECWKVDRLGWDDILPEDKLIRIRKMIALLEKRDYDVPIWLGYRSDEKLELHVFTDANEQSMGAVLYALNPLTGKLVLLYAKSVLHTRKTIPEAELDAILLGISLVDKEYCNHVGVLHLWTDSMINYHRMTTKSINELKYQQARKVKDSWIVFAKYSSTIGHIESHENPADYLTKFERKDIDWDFWFSPPIPISHTETTLCRLVAETSSGPNSAPLDFDLSQHATLDSALKQCSLAQIIQHVQAEAWPLEIRAFREDKPLPRINQLGPYWYEFRNGILYAKLRDSNIRSHVILPRDCQLVHLLMLKIHTEQGHPGASTVYQVFVSEYFSVGCRKTARAIVSNCHQCSRFRKPLRRQGHAPLPLYRLEPPSRAFAYIGMDFAGPFKIAASSYYVLLLTCLHSRAVSLRLLKSQDTAGIASTLLSHSFTHSAPDYVYSDNASVFCKTDKVLQSLYDKRESAVKSINWNFAFPGDPASNGITESMIGLTKKYLRNLTFNSKYTRQDLENYLNMVQCFINNRPLYVHEGEVVTPQHFISGTSTRPMPVPVVPLSEKLPEHKPFLIARRVTHFWESWKNNYLNKLSHQQLLRPRANLKVGDSIIYSPHNVSKRAQWPTGKVTAVYPGNDGVVRCVDVVLDTGETLDRRPVNKLIFLESRVSPAETVSSRNEQFTTEATSDDEIDKENDENTANADL